MQDSSTPQYYRKAYQNFTGGLASRPNPLMISGNQFAQLDNAIINDTDILQKGPGYVLDGSPFPNSTDSFIRMLSLYKVGTTTNTMVCAGQDDGNISVSNPSYLVDLKQTYGDGNYNYIGHTSGTSLFTHLNTTVTGLGTLWTKHLKAGDAIGSGTLPSVWYEIQSVDSDTSITLTSAYAGTTTTSTTYMARIRLSKDHIPYSTAFDDQLIIVNGSETPMLFDNASLVKLQSANIKAASFVVPHKNRVFMFNWAANTSGMIWSSVNDVTTFNAASIASVFPYDNGNIVAALSFSNSLLVFKDNGKIYRVTGEFDQDAVGQPAAITAIDVPDNIGVIAGRTCIILEDNSGTNGYQQLGAKAYFLAETGIYTINTWMQVNKVSWDIQPDVSNLQLKSTVTATKSYSFTAKSQWQTGTGSAISYDRNVNGLSTYFDKLSFTGSDQISDSAASFIDSNNDVHIAWISADNTTVKYTKWLALDNSSSSSSVVVPQTFLSADLSGYTATLRSVAISVSASGKVGIATTCTDPFPGGPFASGSGHSYVLFSEFSAGAWTTTKLWKTINTINNNNSVYGNIAAQGDFGRGLKVYYTAGNDPRVLTCLGYKVQTSAATIYLESGGQYFTRSGSTWSSGLVTSPNNTNFTGGTVFYKECDFVLDGSSNIYAVFAAYQSGNEYVEYAYSSDGGLTWSFPLVSSSLAVSWITPAGTAPSMGNGNISIALDENSNAIILYNYLGGSGGDIGSIIRYNVTPHTPTKTTVASGTAALPFYLKGYYNSAGSGETFYVNAPVAGSYQEQFIFDIAYQIGTASFTNGTKDVIGTGTKWSQNLLAGDIIKLGTDSVVDYGTIQSVNSDTDITLVSNYAGTTTSGAYNSTRRVTVTDSSLSQVVLNSARSNRMSGSSNLFSTSSFGSNANEIVVRRVSTQSKWASPAESDNSLSAWSTYAVTGQVSNGNSVTYKAMLSTSSTLLEANNNVIVPGTVISTSASNVYIKATVSFVLSTFAPASLNTLILNYVGVGADAKMPTAFAYNNELYLGTTKQGQTSNTQILFLDRKGAWGNWTQTATCFTRYNQQLYTGSSINGNIYKLRYGYDYAGSAYSLTAVTKEDLLGSIELQKDIYKTYVIYATQSNGTFTFSYRFDNFMTSGGSSWVDTEVDQTVNGIVEIPMGGTPCTSVQFKVSQGDADVQVGIIGFIVLYKYLHVR